MSYNKHAQDDTLIFEKSYANYDSLLGMPCWNDMSKNSKKFISGCVHVLGEVLAKRSSDNGAIKYLKSNGKQDQIMTENDV